MISKQIEIMTLIRLNLLSKNAKTRNSEQGYRTLLTCGDEAKRLSLRQ